jgi:hypothetical protein
MDAIDLTAEALLLLLLNAALKGDLGNGELPSVLLKPFLQN